jgi:type I restriction enzyme M protein
MKNNLGKLQIFSITNEDVTKKKRIDVEYYQPFFEDVVKKVAGSKYELQKLEDVTLLISNGRTPSKDMYDEDNDQAGSVPIIKAGTASGRFVDLEKLEYAKADFSSGKKAQKGDIFVLSAAHQASYVGKNVSLLDVEPEQDTYFVGELICVRANREKVLPEYLFGFLSSEVGYLLLNREKRGQTSHIYPEDVKTITLPIPSLKDQQKIVAILGKAYEEKKQKEAEIKKILAKIDSFVLGELGIEMPEGGAEKVFQIWSDEIEGRVDALFYKPYLRSLLEQIKNKKHFALGEAIADMSGGATPKVTGDYYSDEGGVPFLRVQNITEMGIKLDDAKFIKPEVHETMLKRSQLKKDDLVFTITGRIGSVAVVPDNFEGNINQHSVRFHLQNEVGKTKVLPEYVASFFNTKIGRELSFRSTTGGTRPALDYDALKKLVVPLPSVEKQEKIISGVKTIYEKVKRLRQEAESVIAEAQKQTADLIFA